MAEKPLSKMGRADLEKLAKKEGVEVRNGDTVADIRESIREARDGGPAPASGDAEPTGGLTFDTRQVRRNQLRKAELAEAQGDNPQAQHIAGRPTQAERAADGADIGTRKGRKPGLSVSAPLAEGTQLFITGRGFPSRVPATFEIKGPFRDELKSSRTDLYGTVQIGLHNPDAGKHKVTVKAGGKTAKLSFETAGRNA